MCITGPMWSTLDRVVVSCQGEAPPEMGPAFPEDPTSRSARRKEADYQLPIDLNSTYSMSFKTSNLDIIDWNVVNIPLLGMYVSGVHNTTAS